MARFILLLLLLAVGCDEPVRSRGTKPDGSLDSGSFSRLVFDGHTYILYKQGIKASPSGLEHDPDCPQCKGSR